MMPKVVMKEEEKEAEEKTVLKDVRMNTVGVTTTMMKMMVVSVGAVI